MLGVIYVLATLIAAAAAALAAHYTIQITFRPTDAPDLVAAVLAAVPLPAHVPTLS